MKSAVPCRFPFFSLFPGFAAVFLLSLSPAKAEQWTFSNVDGNAWSTLANWTESLPGSPVPPGTAGNTYTNVRLNINGLVDYLSLIHI